LADSEEVADEPGDVEPVKAESSEADEAESADVAKVEDEAPKDESGK
jgi:hypothetical protein